MDFTDKTLVCRDCGNNFIFTAGEQGFYLEKGLMNEPQRCPDCRANRRRDRTSGAGNSATTTRESSTITCASCGRAATVPFVPRLDRPVYCADCFSSQRTTAGAGA
jgi:CxxC-x17-CxxC domain-containing protein